MNTRKGGRVGLFDSGVGGLFVLRGFARHTALQKYDISYLGDTAHMPYGSRTTEDVYQLTVRGVEKLFQQGAHIVVLACNTASALALRRIQQEWLPQHYPERRVLGVVIPTIEAAIRAGDSTMLVLGTTGTISSHVYKHEIEKFHAHTRVREVALPYVAQLIEAGQLSYAYALLSSAIADSGMTSGAVLLGCTHYEALAKKLARAFPALHIVAQGGMVATSFAEYLARHPEHEHMLGRTHTRTIQFTAVTKLTQHMTKEWYKGA